MQALEILGIYSLFLVAYGTIGNLLTLLIVCRRKKLFQMPTFVFLAFKVVADLLPLYTYNLNPYLISKIGYNIGDINQFMCRFCTWLFGLSLESSSFLMVIIVWVSYYYSFPSLRNIFIPKGCNKRRNILSSCFEK
jgi:hypothetical protein